MSRCATAPLLLRSAVAYPDNAYCRREVSGFLLRLGHEVTWASLGVSTKGGTQVENPICPKKSNQRTAVSGNLPFRATCISWFRWRQYFFLGGVWGRGMDSSASMTLRALLHGMKGFVIPIKSFVKIGITKIFCYNKMFNSINKTFGCCSKIFGCSNLKFICCP